MISTDHSKILQKSLFNISFGFKGFELEQTQYFFFNVHLTGSPHLLSIDLALATQKIFSIFILPNTIFFNPNVYD